MAHKWGAAVAENGLCLIRLQSSLLGWSPCTLAARALPLSTPPVWITNATVGQFFLAVQIPVDTQLPYVVAAPNKLPGNPHFPYGRDVEADGPV